MTQSARATGNSAGTLDRPRSRERAAWAWIMAGWILPGIALAALYLPALDFDYAWTDTSAIGGRTMLRPPEALSDAFREPLHRIAGRSGAVTQSYYRPLQVIGLSWIDARFGHEPRHFRFAGLMVGALALGFFAAFARQLGAAAPAALMAALFVACHPVGIETYVWIAGGSGALCALFALAALSVALSGVRSTSLSRSIALGALSLAALAAALLSKERAVVEPALLVVVLVGGVYAQRARGETSRWIDRRHSAAIVALHAAIVGLYVFAWRPQVLGTFHIALPPVGGSTATQVASAVANWPAKLAWLFVPLHSSTSDVIRIVDSGADAQLWLGVAVALGSAVAFILCLRRGRPLAAVGLAWIWIAYAPTAGLFPLLHANGERYWFLSAFGAALVVADLLSALSTRAGRNAAAAAAAVVLLFLGQRTAARIPEWESNLGLFQLEIAREPAFREGYFLVTYELAQRARYGEADAALAPLLRDDPVFAGTASYSNPLSIAELACSLALVQKRYDAILALEQTLAQTHPSTLRAAPIRTCIGQANDALGNTPRALELFEGVAAELGPHTPPALPFMIAQAHFRLGDFEAAHAWLQRARSAAGPDAALQQQIRSLNRRLSTRRNSADSPPGAP